MTCDSEIQLSNASTHAELEAFSRSLELKLEDDPCAPRLLRELHTVYMMLGEYKKAARIAKGFSVLMPQLNWIYGYDSFHHFRNGDFRNGAADLLRHYNSKRGTHFSSLFRIEGAPLWYGSNPRGRKILFVAEAGFGDHFFQLRWVKWLLKRGAIVDVYCRSELASVFSRVPGVRRVMSYGADRKVEQLDQGDLEYWVPGQGAFSYLGIESWDQINGTPYLSASRDLIQQMTGVVRESEKLKVGIRWSGLGLSKGNDPRRIPPEHVLSLSDNSLLDVYSFQLGDDAEQVKEWPKVHDLAPHLETWEHTLAALSKLNVLVTSDTAIAHASAALGIPTWVVLITSHVSQYWALDGEKTPFYNSVRLFKQNRYKEWSDVFARVRAELHARATEESVF